MSRDAKKAERRAKRKAKRDKPKPRKLECALCKMNPHDPRHAATHAIKVREHADFVRSIYRCRNEPEPLCQDCGVNTLGDETFWVWESVWEEAKGDNFLCVGCLEKRIGRELEPNDFNCISSDGVSVNYDPWIPRSERLKQRMGFPVDVERMIQRPKIIRNGNAVSIQWQR
jgi:hypothetical protein